MTIQNNRGRFRSEVCGSDSPGYVNCQGTVDPQGATPARLRAAGGVPGGLPRGSRISRWPTGDNFRRQIQREGHWRTTLRHRDDTAALAATRSVRAMSTGAVTWGRIAGGMTMLEAGCR